MKNDNKIKNNSSKEIENGFIFPENYFSTLEQNINQKIHSNHISLKRNILKYSSIAAVLTILLISGIILLQLKDFNNQIAQNINDTSAKSYQNNIEKQSIVANNDDEIIEIADDLGLTDEEFVEFADILEL